jgi:Uncharacterized alpha/beta hydrolase domain (DUF2235)
MFLGAFDTVKALNDRYLYDISLQSSVFHFRHALALNEERVDFRPEVEYPRLSNATSHRSALEAWFLGSHSDIGGATDTDGLSLYPLQWILSDSQDLGLVLEFQRPTGRLNLMDNPLRLVYPVSSTTNFPDPPFVFEIENGIRVKVQDFREVHQDEMRVPSYRVKIHRPSTILKYRHTARDVFQNHDLKGYDADSTSSL